MSHREAELPSPSLSRSADASIVVVEDEPVTADLVAGALRGRGLEVTVALTGRQALDLVSATEPDIVLLDLGLPDIDGVEVCRRLRRWYANPIIVLSASGEEERKIAALDDGADDYVTKPFAMGELMARLRVAIRHRHAVEGASGGATLEAGDLWVDTAARQVRVAGAPVPFSRKEFELMVELLRRCGKVVTHARLLGRIWNTDDLAKTETLRVHVNQVRRKLGAGPRTPVIESVPGVGYRMVRPDG